RSAGMLNAAILFALVRNMTPCCNTRMQQSRRWIYESGASATAILIGVCLTAGQAIPSTSKTSQQWKEFAYPNHGFEIQLPEPPNAHGDTQLDGGTAYTVNLPRAMTVTIHVGTFPAGCMDVYSKYVSTLKLSTTATKGASRPRPSIGGALNVAREINV